MFFQWKLCCTIAGSHNSIAHDKIQKTDIQETDHTKRRSLKGEQNKFVLGNKNWIAV